MGSPVGRSTNISPMMRGIQRIQGLPRGPMGPRTMPMGRPNLGPMMNPGMGPAPMGAVPQQVPMAQQQQMAGMLRRPMGY